MHPPKLVGKNGSYGGQETPKSVLLASIRVQVPPMSKFFKGCFSKVAQGPTFAWSLNSWRTAMQVLFKSRDPQATELRKLTEGRVRFVLRRLGWRVPRAEVQMSDVNGPRGGVDKRCQVELKTDVAGTVVVTSVAADWLTALNKALAKATRFLLCALSRGKGPRRLRQRGPTGHLTL